MKKILLLSVILALLLNTPAFASENKRSLTIDAGCNLPEVRVTVPSTAEVYFNPFKLPVEINGESLTDQILFDPVYIKNESEVPLSVSVSAAGTLNEGSNMRLVTVSTKGSTTTSKCAFIYFEMQVTDDPDNPAWDAEYDAEKHLVIRTSSKSKKDIAVIAQADQPKHFAAFRLTGDCVPTPKKGWTEADGLNVEIAFTFKPLSITTEVP